MFTKSVCRFAGGSPYSRSLRSCNLSQNEDVISDKHELSLMEGTRVDVAVESMESALSWLRAQEELPWQKDLELRLELRKVGQIRK